MRSPLFIYNSLSIYKSLVLVKINNGLDNILHRDILNNIG